MEPQTARDTPAAAADTPWTTEAPPADARPLAWIRVLGGAVFEGTPAQFADCFFSNVSEDEVRRWAERQQPAPPSVEFWYEGDPLPPTLRDHPGRILPQEPPLPPTVNLALVRTADERKQWYSGTLNLPKTAFPMMHKQPGDRRRVERTIISKWDSVDLHGRSRARSGAPTFVLHDGPPYANGDIHMGHAVNKVLKDMIVRFKSLRGFDARLVPGWDCHGLPIEQAVQKSLSRDAVAGRVAPVDPREFRDACRLHARQFVDLQTEQFKSLAVGADYQRRYTTLHREYESGVVRLLGELVGAGVVYRDKKPVLWCMKHRTALAEAEVEYGDAEDRAVYVKAWAYEGTGRYGKNPEGGGVGIYPLAASEKKCPWRNLVGENHPLRLMVWTTTPWTLPANRAIAVNPDADYVCVWSPSEREPTGIERIIVAADLAERVHFKGNSLAGAPFKGAELVGMEYSLNAEYRGKVVAADYVTTQSGTGLVHVAPGFGPEDFAVGRANGLEVFVPVDDGGYYTYGYMEGRHINEVSRMVITTMGRSGQLHAEEGITHSCPRCWRCRERVIYRATDQWFISAESSSAANKAATQHARAAKWIPDWGLARFEGMLKTRPDWCISRQRLWGIPIPYFVHKPTRKVVMTRIICERVADYFARHGADSWYSHTPRQILGDDISGVDDFEKGTDILDVWFESGASHATVMGEDGWWGIKYPADLYLEGSDQHRGWFQASLLTSFLRDDPPARAFLTHGFVLDKDGRKMSKELGNVIKVTDAVEKYGTDVVRLWVASVDYTEDMTCSDELFRNTTEAYRKIRNTIRYLLSNLYDYETDNRPDVSLPDPDDLDSYMLWRLCDVTKAVIAAYEAFDFKTASKTLYDFLNLEVSAVYAKAIKDRLYCEWSFEPRRRSAQKVCLHLAASCLEMLAPILPVMAEEAWEHLTNLPCGGFLPYSVHLSQIAATTDHESYAGGWTELVKLLPQVTMQLDRMKKEVGLTNALDAEVVLTIPMGAGWSKYGKDFEDACGVGFHSFRYGDTLSVQIEDRRGKYARCERSRKRRPDVGQNPRFPDLSTRDAAVVEGLMRGEDL
jgi:isoleucyl-tRNA synthetase